MLQESIRLVEFAERDNSDTYDLKIQQVGYEACGPSHHYGPAIRQHYLIHFVKSGKGVYQYKDEKVEVSENELFLIPPNEVTNYEADDENPWEYYWFGVSGNCCESLLRSIGFENGNRKVRYNLASSYSMDDTIKEITDRKTLKQSDKIFEIAKLYEIFSWLRKSYELKMQGGTYVSSEKSLLKAAEEYMRRSYMLDITIQDVAKHIGVDRTQVYRYFKKAHNKSPKEYLIDIRMGEAEKLICDTQLSIKQISYSVGYTDQYLFSKMFKKMYGYSPKNFRKELEI